MNLPTIAVTEEEATEKLAEYEKTVVEERTVEDEAIAQAYRAAKRGHQIVRLSQAVLVGGWFDDGMPRIAIAGAMWPQCVAKWSGDNLIFSERDWVDNRGALVGRSTVRVPLHNEISLPVRSWRRSSAPVPLIPPRHRPKPHRLRHCHVLWEVDSWTPVPSKDPALVRHIRGDLWAVLATWDLTELEMAVLTQRSA